MGVIRTIALGWVAAMAAFSARADMPSYRVSHPVGWMYSSPVGETPGWSKPRWFNIEFNQSNVWNWDTNITDRRTGDEYLYKADFEQTSVIIDTGFAVSNVGFSIEVPYANRNGGFLDDFIDQFHTFGRFDRFMRHEYGKFDNEFIIRKNGQDQIVTHKPEGVGNLKTKIKWWLLPWRSPTPGACECGFALSAQVKFPVQKRQLGLTSGAVDYSALAHLGVPLRQFSGAWATAAVTKQGYNKTFDGWPQKQWQHMYELTLNVGFNANFGLLLQARTESELFEQKYLRLNYTYLDPDSQLAEREASGWLALTEWRGSQSAGLYWRWGEGHQISGMIIEDWGLGDRESGSWNYVTGAPDVAFAAKLHIVF